MRVRVCLEEPAILSLYMDMTCLDQYYFGIKCDYISDSLMCIMFMSSSEHNNHM